MDNLKPLKIIKIGGNVIDDAAALSSFLNLFSSIEGPKILVHGGGKSATALAQQTGLEVQMVDGRRITDAATLELITMVYAGKINKTIVAQLQALDCNALGFTGADANTITSIKRPVSSIDYGFVGDVKNVETSILEVLLNQYTMNDFQGTYGRGMFLYSLIASDDFIVGKSKSQIEDIKDFLTTGSA